jgi:hypothetical protein
MNITMVYNTWSEVFFLDINRGHSPAELPGEAKSGLAKLYAGKGLAPPRCCKKSITLHLYWFSLIFLCLCFVVKLQSNPYPDISIGLYNLAARLQYFTAEEA